MEGTLRPGMDLVVTKWIGMRGTVQLAEAYREELKRRFALPFIRKAEALSQQITIHPDLELAREFGATAWCEVSEGGVFAALWQMAQASGVGLEMMLRQLPIRQETIEICEFFDINPYIFCRTDAFCWDVQTAERWRVGWNSPVYRRYGREEQPTAMTVF